MKINKLTIILLIILQVFAIFSYVFAVDEGESVLLYPTEKMDYIKVGYWGQDLTIYHTVYAKDGKEYPAYCVDYTHKGITDERKYSVKITQNYVDENYNSTDKTLAVWRVILNGYPFKTIEGLNDYEAYAATKLAVFYVLENWEENKDKIYYKNDEGKKVIDAMFKIVESAKNYTKVPTNTTVSLNETDWQIDEINNKFLSKKVTLNSQTLISGFTVNLDGNIPEGAVITDLKNNELQKFRNCKEFKVLLPLEKLKWQNEFTINVAVDVNSYPMYLGEPEVSGVQSYVLTAGIVKQEGASKLIEYPENKTKLIIEKKDIEGNALKGVKFNILDSNKNIVYENIKTDEFGKVTINNMIPGTYYIQEIEPIEGYEIKDEVIEVTIQLNEEGKVLITNERIPEEPEIPEEPLEPIIVPEEPKKLPRTGW